MHGKIAALLLALVAFCFGDEPLNLTYAQWEMWMLGVTGQERADVLRADVKSRSVKLGLVSCSGMHFEAIAGEFRNGSSLVYGEGSGRDASSSHDDNQVYEIIKMAQLLKLAIQVVVYHPSAELPLAACFEKAASECDLVFCYSSFWHGPDVRALTEIVRRHPAKLFLGPYGEIGNCPPTSTSYQGQGRKWNGTGLKNLVLTSPLARNSKGALLHPSRRDGRDTETVVFFTPSSWAHGPGETCPSVGVAVILASYAIAATNCNNAERVIQLIAASLVEPGEQMLGVVDFDQAAVDRCRQELDFLTTTDGEGRRGLVFRGIPNLWRMHEKIAGEQRTPLLQKSL